MKQAVFVLHARESGAVLRIARLARLSNLRCGKIGAAYLAYLARRYQFIERAERVGYRDVGVGQVLLIKIHVIGSEALEARFEGSFYIFGSRPSTLTRHVVAKFRRDDYISPPIPQNATKQLFTSAIGVHIGSVEQVDPKVNRLVDYFPRLRLIDASAKIVTSHADH
jgi:hypothetical protein